MSNYYDKYIKYKNKYLEIKNKQNEFKQNESKQNESKQNELNQNGGLIENNISNTYDLFLNYISPHHKFLINNPNILYNNQERNKYLLSTYIENEINEL
jgi:hypothetical protein